MKSRHAGFTLLEILLVVAAVGLLAAIVFVAINPNEQLAKVRDTERQSEVDTLHDAIRQYSTDNGGTYPSIIAEMSNAEAKEICADGVSDEACINLTDDLTPEYLAEVPSDPQADGTGSEYVVSKQNDRVRVSAPEAEESEDVIMAGYSSNKLLDEQPFATLAYSTRILREGHVTETRQSGTTAAGSYLVRIRQDNTNNDIADVLPDDNGELSANSTVQNTTNSSDGQTLGTWVGSNNAYVTTWYDQSTENNQATQTTQSSQPQIVNNGSLIQSAGSVTPDFDGSDDYVKTAHDDSINPDTITVSAWVKSNTADWSDIGCVASKRRSYIFHPYDGENRFRWYVHTDNHNPAELTPTDITQWHLYTGTHDGQEQKVYLDGNLQNTNNLSASINNDTGDFLIGSDSGKYTNGNRICNIKLDNMVIYDKALTSQEITDLYNRGR